MSDVLSCVCLTLKADRSRQAANKSGNVAREAHIKQLRRRDPKKMRVFRSLAVLKDSIGDRARPTLENRARGALHLHYTGRGRWHAASLMRVRSGVDHTRVLCSAHADRARDWSQKRDHTRLGQIASGTDRGPPGGVGREMCLT